MSANIYVHEPVGLSLVVLQPVVPSHSVTDSVQLDSSDLNLPSCYYRNQSTTANGYTNGHGASKVVPIFRQGETVTLPRCNGQSQPMRILTLDPVQQGVVTQATRIIITTSPYVEEKSPSWNDMDGAISESSHGRTHLSMANFDPDAFLSSSLDLHFSQSSPLLKGSPSLNTLDLGESSHSSTSGSITPRPNGFAVPPSPPAQIEEIGIDEELESGGKRFHVVIAAGPPGERASRCDDVCWVGVTGLGRAGIFEGDWVCWDSVQAHKQSG
jgi:peroxin-6